MLRRTIFVVGLPTIVFGSWLYAQLRGQATVEFIDAPSEWVAFDANFEKTSPGAVLTITGHVYRSNDGSLREEWEVGGRGTVLVQLKNVARSLYYVLRQDNKNIWEEHPMVLPKEGYRPLLRSTAMNGLSPNAGDIEGLPLYRYVPGGSGMIHLQSPDLNFFPLVSQDVNTGARMVYFDIHRRSQPEALFMPPPDATVVHVNTPMGIVEIGPGQAVPPFPENSPTRRP